MNGANQGVARRETECSRADQKAHPCDLTTGPLYLLPSATLKVLILRTTGLLRMVVIPFRVFLNITGLN